MFERKIFLTVLVFSFFTLLQFLFSSSLIIAQSTPPDIIVSYDEAESEGEWTTASWPGNGSTALYDRIEGSSTGSNFASKTYRPVIVQSGYYKVYYHLRNAANGRTDEANYTIEHAYGTDYQTIDQNQSGGMWHLMGEYPFIEGDSGFVKLDNINPDMYVIAESIKFEYLKVLDGGHDFHVFGDGLDHELSFSWEMLSGTDEYKVFYGTQSGVYSSEISAGVSNTINITGLNNHQDYFIKVKAYQSGSFIGESNERMMTPENPYMPNGEIILDNVQAETVGTWIVSTWPSPRYNSNYFYASSGSSSDLGVVTYRPDIQDAGEYEIYQYLPKAGTSRKTNVKYTIEHADGIETLYINQVVDGGEWQSLGVYDLSAGTTSTVNIHDENIGGYINADAVKFVYLGPSQVQNPPPDIPVNLTSTAQNEAVSLNWDDVTDADSYTIKYGTTSGVYTEQMTVTSSSAVITGLVNDIECYFAVQAENTNGVSSLSTEVSATPELIVPLTNNPVTFVSNIDYNAQGQMTKVEYGNGNTTHYEYHPLNFRLTRIHTTNSSSASIQDLRYTYDGVGNIIEIEDLVHTDDQTFEYDELGRLTQAVGEEYGVEDYTYDEIGNMTSKKGIAYTYNQIDAGPHAVTSLSDGTTFTYDANGNMASKQNAADLWEYTYDVENRLTGVKKNGEGVSIFEYDGDGGRTKKITADNVHRFIGGVYEESNGQYSNNIYIGDQKIATITNNQVLYYHANHLGSTNLLTDETGTTKELMQYTPYGEFAKHEKYGTPEEEARFYFTQQYLDSESELYYYNARYYDPSLGRFISADEFVPPGSGTQELNRYSYVLNNPILYTDPTGHFFQVFAAVFSFVGKVASAVAGFAAAHPVIAGAIVGGIAGGVASYQATGQVSFLSVALGALQGGLSGGTLGLSGSALGAALPVLKMSAAASLAGQVARAAGWENVANGLNAASTVLSAVYVGINVGVGLREWAVGELTIYDMQGNPSIINSNETVYTNGVNTSSSDALLQAQEISSKLQIDKIAHNETHGFVADFTESILQKLTFTSSIDRQLANQVKGLSNITLAGHSQGSITIGNTLLNLGFRDARNSVVNAQFYSTPLSQPRAFISSAIGGTSGNVLYANNFGDPINLVGPNLNPFKFLSGFTFQLSQH